MDEARNVRLQAIEDAKNTRERELTELLDAMRTLRQSAETQIDNTLRTAGLESERLLDQAKNEAQTIIERATDEARTLRAEAESLRLTAEERLRDVQQLEGEFNTIVSKIAQRIGLEAPEQGWWRHLLHRK
jgi:cell division septum initiation protein DivIVA